MRHVTKKHVLGVAAGVAVAAGAVLVAVSPAAADSIGPSDRSCFEVSGSATGGDAAVVNLTPVLGDGVGYGQIVSSDVARPPVVANVNYRELSADPNVGVASVGSDGTVCFVNSPAGRVHLVADQLGFIDGSVYVPATSTGAAERKVDTRIGLGGTRVAPNGRLCFGVSGSPGDAAIVNLTPVGADGVGFGQMLSSDVTTAPVVANVNYSVGSVDPNIAISAIGADGRVCFVNGDRASTELVADHIGTVDASGYLSATPSGAAIRRVDTRIGTGGVRVGPNGRLCFDVTGDPGDSAIVNLTPVRASGRGYGLLVSSDVTSVPVAASVNYTVGSVDPNVSIAPIGADGQVCYVNGPGEFVDIVADQIGTFAAAAYRSADARGIPIRQIDTRLTASRRDIVLAPSAVGLAAFGRPESDVLAYVRSGLGSPRSDITSSFPFTDRYGFGFEDSDGLGFAHPFGREVCFSNDLCLFFGGSLASNRTFVGYTQGSGAESSPPASTGSGVTVGSRWFDHQGSITVQPVGCYAIGYGLADGVPITMFSSSGTFGAVDGFGNIVPSTPNPLDVVVTSLYSGDLYYELENDC